MNLPIYMDGHATTRVDPRVVAAMVPFFGEYYGNAASRHHQFGWAARDAVVESRLAVAKLIGATSREVVFTSGATESNNLALKGVVDASRARGNHIVTVCTEHRAILDPCARLEQQGVAVSYLPVRPTVLPCNSLWRLGLLNDSTKPCARAGTTTVTTPPRAKNCATQIRVVQYHHVAGPQGIGECIDRCPHRGRHGPQVDRNVGSLGHHLGFGVEHCAREVVAFMNHR